MDEQIKRVVPGWYWIVAILLLLWALAGCAAYVMQVTMSAADIAKLPKAQADIWRMMPGWATAAYAIAVWVGLAGAAALVMRRRWARTAYLVSLIAVVVQFGWVFLASPILSTVGPSSAGFPAFIVVITLFALWFSGYAIRKGWLR